MSNRDNFLPPQGLRKPRGRRGRGGIVPAPPASSSRQGLVEALPTGAATERTTVVQRSGLPPPQEEPTPGTSREASDGRSAPPESELGVRPRKRARVYLDQDPEYTGWKPIPPLKERFRPGVRPAQWSVPRSVDRPSVEDVLAGAGKAVDMIGDLIVAPVGPGGTGRRLRTLCMQSVQGFRELDYALGDLANMADMEAYDRLKSVEQQVRGMKTALARVERVLAGLVSGVPVTPGHAPTPQPVVGPIARPKPGATATAEAEKEEGGKWRTVSRKSRRKKKEGPAPPAALTGPPGGRKPAQPRKPGGKGGKGGKGEARPSVPPTPQRRRRTAPRHAAVTITATGGRSYAEILGEAREKVDLADMGIDIGSRRGLAIKRARNGGYLLEVLGKDSALRADRLARELEDVLSGDAKVARPTKSAEMRIVGLDDSATPQMVLQALSRSGERPPADFRLGTIRRSPGGLGAVWVRCPLSAAVKIDAAGGLKVGWAFAKARLLEERPLQCYRCLGYGHLAAACSGPHDLKGRCFRCGGVGHVVRTCTESVRCLPCDMMGRDPSHRMGGRSCPAAGASAAKAKAKAPRTGEGKGGRSRSARRARASAVKEKGGAPEMAPPAAAGGSGIRDSGAVRAPSPVIAETSRQDEGEAVWPSTQAIAVTMGWTQPEGSSPVAGEQEGEAETQVIPESPSPNEESQHPDSRPQPPGQALRGGGADGGRGGGSGGSSLPSRLDRVGGGGLE